MLFCFPMQPRLFVFVTIVTAILSLASFYIGSRFITRFEWAQNHKGIIWFGIALFILLQLLGPLLYRMWPTPENQFFILHWLTYVTLGIFGCLFFYTVVADLFFWIVGWFTDGAQDAERRTFLGVAAVSAATAGVGLVQALQGPKVFEVDVPVKNLPPDLEGFKIAQVSDLHVGPTIGKGYAADVARITNSLAPDVIALTGDMCDGLVESLKDSMAPLSTLTAKHGIFYCTGNHEYYWGANEWVKHFEGMGFTPLLNAHRVLTIGSAQLVVGGVTDLQGGRFSPDHASDPAKAFAGAPQGGNAVRILLAHQPGSFQAAEPHGVALQLSGHTHAGQFFPWTLAVRLVHRYWVGLNRHSDTFHVYVNRGTGYWGPPIRFLVPAEITLLRLKRA